MPESSRLDQGQIELVTHEVKIDGTPIPDHYEIISISVSKSLNKIATAKIEFLDGNHYEAEFQSTNEETYEVGKEVEIMMGYDSSNEKIFKGVIVKHGIKIKSIEKSVVTIECADKSIVLTGQREFKVFLAMKDSDIIEQLANDKGIDASCESTETTHEAVIQQNCTAWDFIVTRAQANYMVVNTIDGKVNVVKPTSGAQKNLKATFGDNIVSMDMSVDARSQLKDVKTSAWDYSTQSNSSGESQEPSEVDGQGSIRGTKLAADMKYKTTKLQSTGKMEKQELDQWAKSTLLISRLSKIKGVVKVRGYAKINPNDFLTMEGVSPYLTGDAYVTGVHHENKEGDYMTEITVGMHPDLFVNKKTDVTLPIADGLFPGYPGLFIGKVVQVQDDPEGESRVMVKIPLLGENVQEGVWARVSNIMASQEFGSIFMPEVDDEVVLGALGGDLRFPIILGHLYSSQRVPPNDFRISDENHDKGWKTRSGMLFHWDDEKSIIRTETPAGQKIILDDNDQSITLEDQHGNKMVMNSNGFKFTGQKDFVIDVMGKIEAKAMGEVKIDSTSATIKGKGMQGVTWEDISGSKLEASAMGVTASSNAGIATIKGSMVMIN